MLYFILFSTLFNTKYVGHDPWVPLNTSYAFYLYIIIVSSDSLLHTSAFSVHMIHVPPFSLFRRDSEADNCVKEGFVFTRNMSSAVSNSFPGSLVSLLSSLAPERGKMRDPGIEFSVVPGVKQNSAHKVCQFCCSTFAFTVNRCGISFAIIFKLIFASVL